MSMLTKAIKFRKLISELTNKESHTFLSNLLNSHVDVILSGLFCHFIHVSNQSDLLNDFNDSLSNIIQERKEKPKLECAAHIKLNQIPSAIINFTASFLEQSDYIHFSISNRVIYLGCNSPNALRELDCEYPWLINSYSSINLPSLRSIFYLNIDPNQTLELQSFTAPIFGEIGTLRLHRTNGETCRFQEFLNKNIVNCDTITRLECDDLVLERDEFLYSLKQLRNLKHLELEHVDIEQGLTADQVAKECPNIMGLYLNDNIGIAGVIRVLSPKLKYLSFGPRECHEIYQRSVTFDPLEELRIIMPTFQTLSHVLKSAPRLKKIALVKICMKNTQIKEAMTNILLQGSLISYMRYGVGYNNFIHMMQGIECGLKGKKQQRKELKIDLHINLDGADKNMTNDFASHVARVVREMEACVVNDFMFIVQFKGGKMDHLVQKIFQDLLYLSVFTDYTNWSIFQDKVAYKFVIANQNCKINGFKDTVCGWWSSIDYQ